jgi:hypothetical protein
LQLLREACIFAATRQILAVNIGRTAAAAEANMQNNIDVKTLRKYEFICCCRRQNRLKATVRETAEIVAKHLHGYCSFAEKKRGKDLTLLLKKLYVGNFWELLLGVSY